VKTMKTTCIYQITKVLENAGYYATALVLESFTPHIKEGETLRLYGEFDMPVAVGTIILVGEIDGAACYYRLNELQRAK
jgi:hypothetical protein